MIELKIGFVGAGRMARALAGGLVRAGLVAGERLSAADPEEQARADFTGAVVGAQACTDNAAVVKHSDVVVFAVKPQQMLSVLQDVRSAVTSEKLFISIAAGVTLETICDALGTDRLVRVMPNTPCLVGRSASGYCLGAGASAADEVLAKQLLESVGVAFPVDEPLLNAVTGLSGSGPAFVFVMIEALSDGGVRMGLTRNVANQLAAHTVCGAAEMVLATGRHPAELKDDVASPGGTTIAGLQALEKGGIRSALIAAVEAATRRSIELGNR